MKRINRRIKDQVPPAIQALLDKSKATKMNKIDSILKSREPMVQNILKPREISTEEQEVTVELRNGLGNRIFQILAAIGYGEKYKKTPVLCKAFSNDGPKRHEKNLDDVLIKIFPNLKVINFMSSFNIIGEKQYFKYTELDYYNTDVVLKGYFQAEGYLPSPKQIPDIRTTYYDNTYFIHIRAGDYLIFHNEWGIDVVDYLKKCLDRINKNKKYIVFSDDVEYARGIMNNFDINCVFSDKTDPYETLVEMANCAGGICANSSFSWLGALFQKNNRGQIFMPSIWNKIRDCSGVYPKWATIIEAIPNKTQIPRDFLQGESSLLRINNNINKPDEPILKQDEPILKDTSSDRLVTVKLSGCGFGNKVFMILAALGYAEKYNKEFVFCINLMISESAKPHEKRRDELLISIFPDIRWVDSLSDYTPISEKKEIGSGFTYEELPYKPGNVKLQGYFQNAQYFPLRSIPKIRTSYYKEYFVHIRAGDYLGDPDGWGYDKTIYYSNCFNILGPEVSYIVFSDDTSYAEKYMKQFNVKYIISDKTCALETLVEMSNCAGAICANSSFSWLASFFQGDNRKQSFMPSIWHKNHKDVKMSYPDYITVVSVDSSVDPIIKMGITKYNGSPCKLYEWQNSVKEPSSLIVQASSVCGGDLWMPFPIGMSWQYVKYFNNSRSWQVGSHENLVLCAISQYTDTRRRPIGINRQQIIHTLQNNNIQNTNLSGETYFSSLPSYKFVISPEGNGIDCHRHYEALLAGCIPIIEYNDKIVEKYKGCPVLYTNNYSEITYEYLKNKYEELSNIKYDYSRLFLSYYSLEEQDKIRKCGTYWIKKLCHSDKEWYGPSITWITLINKGYIDFTRNFIESMKRNNCIFNLILYCTDNDSMKAFKSYPNIICVDAKEILKFKMSKSLSQWGALEYKHLVFAKLDAIKHALTKYSSYIGYIDTDIILFKNPTETIMNIFKSNPETIFVSQCDEGKHQCSNFNNCQHFCSGVIVFKNIDIVNKLLEYNDHDIEIASSDQMHLLNMANKYKIKHITVDKNIFLNGVYPGVNKYDVKLTVPNTADLIHYNYLTGINKMKLMQKNNMWYI